MFFVELVFMFLKIIARVTVYIIIIVVLRDFIVNGFLYVGDEFSAVYERAGI